MSEQQQAQTQHDGILHGNNTYRVIYMLPQIPSVTSVRIGHDAVTNDEVWLSPKQALSLLDWLKQEKIELERLAKEEKDE